MLMIWKLKSKDLPLKSWSNDWLLDRLAAIFHRFRGLTVIRLLLAELIRDAFRNYRTVNFGKNTLTHVHVTRIQVDCACSLLCLRFYGCVIRVHFVWSLTPERQSFSLCLCGFCCFVIKLINDSVIVNFSRELPLNCAAA